MHSNYLSGTFDITLRRFTVSVLVRYLQPRLYNGDFTHIYVRGLSGLTIGSMVAYELDAPMVALRKSESHGDSPIEGLTESARCCIIDDLLCTGETIRVMRDELHAPEQFAGLCLYHSNPIIWQYQTELTWIRPYLWYDFHCKNAFNETRTYNECETPAELARIYTEMREPAEIEVLQERKKRLEEEIRKLREYE